MDERFRSNQRTPQHSVGRNSIFGRQSLFNNPTTGRNSMRPSDVGRFSYANVQASAIKKNMAQQITNAVKKLPSRNVRDRAHIEEQKQIIRDFLVDKNSQIDPKCLTSPTSGQFQALFELIYAFLDPDYHVNPGTIKDEFPAIMKSLQYPLPIKVSTMQAVSSGTSWPYILDALGYLVTFVNKVNNMNVMALIEDDSRNASRRFYSYDYFTKCFKKQKAEKVSEDGFKAEYDELRQAVMEDENVEKCEELAKEKLALEEELDELKKASVEDQCIELEEEEKTFQKDIKALINYVEDAKECHQSRLNEEEQVQTKVDEKEKALKKVQDEINAKREKINNQPVSAQQAREASTKLAAVRERYKLIRADHNKYKEEPTKLQGILFKLLSSIRERIAILGGKISEVAEDFYSREEFSRHGFSDLGIDRAMDIDAVKERLQYLCEMHKMLLDRMTEDMEHKRVQIQRNKEASAEYERNIERAQLSTKKYVQDGHAKIKELQRRNNDLKYEINDLEIQASTLNEKQKLADEQLQKVHKELEKLQIQIGGIQILYGRRKKELSEEFGKMEDDYIDKVENEVQKHMEIREIQKEQDAKIDALVEQRTDLTNRIIAISDDGDDTSK